MRQRLPNCERWHPGVPSDWSDYLRKKDGVVIGVRRICLECNRARCHTHLYKLTPPPPIEEPADEPVFQNYGVLPRLTWEPPRV